MQTVEGEGARSEEDGCDEVKGGSRSHYWQAGPRPNDKTVRVATDSRILLARPMHQSTFLCAVCRA